MSEQQEQQSQEISYNLEQIKGLGAVSIAKLNALGIYNIKDLAVAGTVDIASALGKSQDWVFNMILDARMFLNKYDNLNDDIMTAGQYLDLELNREKLKTGVDSLDNLLGGGIETRCITEFYGKFGSGKSQICFTLAVLATLPKEQGGLDGSTMYIDTEGTFSSVRIKEIISERKLDPSTINKIYRRRPESAALLELHVNNLSSIILERNIKLVVVDSIIILHRQEYIGREQLSRRQQSLSAVMNKLLKLAESYNIAVVITNQISSDPGANPLYHEEVDHATGGNVIAHASSHRIHLERLSKKVKATMVDSPRLDKTECYFTLEPRGIDKFVEKKRGE
jgi:DNA repair protein RadA